MVNTIKLLSLCCVHYKSEKQSLLHFVAASVNCYHSLYIDASFVVIISGLVLFANFSPCHRFIDICRVLFSSTPFWPDRKLKICKNLITNEMVVDFDVHSTSLKCGIHCKIGSPNIITLHE